MEPLRPARLEFADDGTPYSSAFGDVYHSAHGGPAQARHVFLGGNELPQRWQGRDRFVILETGFGLGLNFLAAWQAWRADPQRCRRLHFVSFEKHPFSAADLAVAQRAWPEFAELAAQLQARWPLLTPGVHRLFLDDRQVILTLFFGDATTQLRTVDASVDAFFLDGFSPAKNPELWTPELCRALSRLAAPGATLATWSVAGHVRAALEAAEFDLEKRPGFAGKRQMLHGRFRSRRPDRHAPPAERRAVVIGAGIAGCTAASALAGAGWQVDIIERAPTPATGASCNVAGVLRPLPSADDNRLSRLTRAGYLATRALLQSLPDARWSPCGVLHLGREPLHEATQQRVVERLQLPAELLQFVDRERAGAMLGLPVEAGGWWFPQGGWVNPASVCRAALAAFPGRIREHYGVTVDRLERTKTGWRLLAADGSEIASAPVVVMAAGVGAPAFAEFAWLPQKSARGQVSHLPPDPARTLAHVVCRHGYAMPEVDGIRLTGATLQPNDPDPSVRTDDHAENLARLRLSLPGYLGPDDPAPLAGRTGFRPMSPDRLPIVGALPDPAAIQGQPRLPALPRHPGLWCVQGFGARGIVWSALMADLLVSRLEGDPLPLEIDLVDAVDPGRFLLKSRARPQDDDAFDDRT
ncbi:bifunctional tRNA (5-methylaminomethyl-2-thiouridine)(34)-methyltransferase MnmD/FAD-dependent 5-carboxymethylaminomethyl-2-thiouridine(34) oxidoreductase MnmC [Azonexus hydrophilus]|uniref:bifunctional tRNA (5-methylaminomethyl-2-thiouridine)(34)-methyltransferase MnmD/FAD-dependent 5-carboxymethylaminomethyl-2-thiouridine(34) oxidoreductase MnmC n=1 Tax=Azonexus hydrophilus TaxID=418702 RepID=UPI002490256D|nr:bifunctional tRNA (5-methylaminomethyl-2-thiouridine)(34)-methyltransferase MnmD/FAD-dependent 5-carboxymethylaminomethyl-2-thiouridine(34) oxidoreductase MnmC [Azonexus hydrophilus]